MNDLMPAVTGSLEYEESGNDVLVHDRERRRIHVLNHSAAAILRACDGRTPIDTVAQALNAPSGYDVRRDIAAILEEFERLELTVASSERNTL